jgi:hypothetical protein
MLTESLTSTDLQTETEESKTEINDRAEEIEE